jgi:hypothetical protein
MKSMKLSRSSINSFVLSCLSHQRPGIKNGKPGKLNLFFARTYIPRWIKSTPSPPLDGIKLASDLVSEINDRLASE